MIWFSSSTHTILYTWPCNIRKRRVSLGVLNVTAVLFIDTFQSPHRMCHALSFEEHERVNLTMFSRVMTRKRAELIWQFPTSAHFIMHSSTAEFWLLWLINKIRRPIDVRTPIVTRLAYDRILLRVLYFPAILSSQAVWYFANTLTK